MSTMYTPQVQRERILFARKHLRLLPDEKDGGNMVQRDYKQHYENEDDIVLVVTEKFRTENGKKPSTYASRVFLTNEDLVGTFWASDKLVWGVGKNLSFNLGNQIVKVLGCGEDGDGYKVKVKMRDGSEELLVLSHRLPRTG